MIHEKRNTKQKKTLQGAEQCLPAGRRLMDAQVQSSVNKQKCSVVVKKCQVHPSRVNAQEKQKYETLFEQERE